MTGIETRPVPSSIPSSRLSDLVAMTRLVAATEAASATAAGTRRRDAVSESVAVCDVVHSKVNTDKAARNHARWAKRRGWSLSRSVGAPLR